MQELSIKIVNSPSEAPNYVIDHKDVKPAVISRVIIVCKGTVSGKSTVDFHIYTKDGSKFVAMLTGSLVTQLAAAIAGAEAR